MQGLRKMSLAKAVPNGIKDKECERFAIQKHPFIPYVLEKDLVQETVSALKSDQSLKTTIGEDAGLHIPIWHTGMRKAFLIHMSTAHNAIKKRGTFKAYKEAVKAYVEQHKAVKQAKASLATRKLLRNLPRKLLRKLQRRTRKAWLWSMHQPQFCMWSISLTTQKPSLPQRPPRTSAKPLLPRCFSSMQICFLWMPSMRGTRYLVKEQTEADPSKDL
jgi:hypothetical protein